MGPAYTWALRQDIAWWCPSSADAESNGGTISVPGGAQRDYLFGVAVDGIPAGGAFSSQVFQVSGPLTGSYSVATAFGNSFVSKTASKLKKPAD